MGEVVRLPMDMLARMNMLNNLLGDLQAKLPSARRDIAQLIDDRSFEERERSIQERHDRHLDAVEAVLRGRFGGVLEVPDEFWRDAASAALCAAEVGV